MRSEEEIRNRFWDYYAKCLRQRKQKYLCRSHLNCKYNGRHRVKQTGTMGFCHNPEVVTKSKRFVTVCNDEDTAKGCEFYECSHTEESVEREMKNTISSPSRCGQEYPKLATFIWVLQDDRHESRFKRLSYLLRSLISFRWW